MGAVFKRFCCLAALAMACGLAYGQNAECEQPNPNNFDQVFACMSTARTGASERANNPFISVAITSCESAAIHYSNALKKARSPQTTRTPGEPRVPRERTPRVSFEDIKGMIPSCDMLARGMEALKGKAPAWSTCTNYPGKFDPGHLKACLDRFLPEHFGGRKTLQTLNGCTDVIQHYEHGLRNATITIERNINGVLPDSYEKPDCTVIASLLGGKGAACLGYTPGVAHLEQCLGADALRYTSCVPLRQAYETKLRQAHGGTFPPNYTVLACDQLAGLVNKAIEREESLKAEADRRSRDKAFAARNPPTQPVVPGGWWPWLAGMSSGLLGYLGRPFYLGFIAHALLAAWSLVYAYKKAKSGEWRYHTSPLRGMFERIFGIKLLFGHSALIGIGIWLTGWTWIIGAALAVLLSRVVMFLMWLFRMFAKPPIVVGSTNTAADSGTSPPQGPGRPDPGRRSEW